MKKLILTILITCLLFSCANDRKEPVAEDPGAPLIPFGVNAYLPHDTSLFTEGLLVHNGQIVESTGSPEELPASRSLIGIYDMPTGKFAIKAELDREKYFGEGVVILGGRVYQLTYKNQKAFVYDARTFRLVDSFSYKNVEGWGLTTDGTSLIMSDGTSVLTWIDPETYKVTKTMEVTDNGVAVRNLNELEFIEGFIYANVWTTNFIVKIHPDDGKVAGKLDLGLLAYESRMKNSRVDVANGIAYDSATKKVYVTGKMWPTIYEIDFVK